MACCKSCARASKIGKTMKRKNSKVTVNPQFLLGMAAGGATGGVVGSALQNISFIQNNPDMSGTIVGAVKAAAGYYLLTQMKGDLVQGVGAGWIAEGAGDVFGSFIPSSVSGFRSNTLGTSYAARHNRKHRVLGPYSEMAPTTGAQAVRVKAI